MTKPTLLSTTACLVLMAGAAAASASVVTSNPSLPPDTGVYLSPSDVHAMFHGPGLAIVLQNIAFALGVKGLFLALGAFGIATMWEAVIADMGVALLAIANAVRAFR